MIITWKSQKILFSTTLENGQSQKHLGIAHIHDIVKFGFNMWRVRNPYDLSRRSYGVHEFTTIHDGVTTMLLRQRHDKP